MKNLPLDSLNNFSCFESTLFVKNRKAHISYFVINCHHSWCLHLIITFLSNYNTIKVEVRKLSCEIKQINKQKYSLQVTVKERSQILSNRNNFFLEVHLTTRLKSKYLTVQKKANHLEKIYNIKSWFLSMISVMFKK